MGLEKFLSYAKIVFSLKNIQKVNAKLFDLNSKKLSTGQKIE
jgi:hypothetical protein